MMGKRKRHSAKLKAKAAMEALRGELTTSQLVTKHGVHQAIARQAPLGPPVPPAASVYGAMETVDQT